MARAPIVQEIEELPEADRLDGFPHPRQTHALFGHEKAEAELAAAFASGRMHHGLLIAGASAMLAFSVVSMLALYALPPAK